MSDGSTTISMVATRNTRTIVTMASGSDGYSVLTPVYLHNKDKSLRAY